MGVPGIYVSSVSATPSGRPDFRLGSIVTDHRTHLSKRLDESSPAVDFQQPQRQTALGQAALGGVVHVAVEQKGAAALLGES